MITTQTMKIITNSINTRLHHELMHITLTDLSHVLDEDKQHSCMQYDCFSCGLFILYLGCFQMCL